MAFCPNCGTPNTDQAEKCVACGFELIVPKQKAKFKGTIMMSGIKAPTLAEAEAASAAAAAAAAAAGTSEPPAAPDGGHKLGPHKTMLGHAPIVIPTRAPAAGGGSADRASPASSSSTILGAGMPPKEDFDASGRSVVTASTLPPPAAAALQVSRNLASPLPPRDPRETRDSSGGITGSGAAYASQARFPSPASNGFESTLPPSAQPATPKPGKIIAIGCAVALALFCVVGSILYYVVGAKLKSMMGEGDSGAEAAAWQASIVQSLAQVSELCKTDCAQAGVYFHPLKEAALLDEAKALTPERLQKLIDPAHTEATMLNGTDDEELASKLGLDPQQCARVSNGAAKVVSCSVPDPTGKPSVLRIVYLAGVGSL